MAKRTIRKTSTGKSVADQIAQEIMDQAEERAEALAVDQELGLDQDEDEADDVPVEGRDIFEEAFAKLEAQNDLPKYIIHKNGTYHAVVSHPYSWEQLQKDHGAGNYRVTAKSVARNIYAGQQTMIIGGPVKDDHAPAQPTAPLPPAGPSPLELFTMMEQLRDKAEAKTREASSSQSNMMAMIMQTMTQMQQQSTQQFQTMLLEMSKTNMTIFQTMQTNNMQAFKELNQQIQNTQKKSDGELSALQLLKLIQDSEARAEDRALKLMEMVEEKAEAMAANAKDEPKEPTEKPSVFERALTSFIPLMQQSAATGLPLPPAHSVPMSQPRPMAVHPNPRPAAPAQGPQAAPQPRPAMKGPQMIKPIPKAPPPPQPEALKKENPVAEPAARLNRDQILEFVAPKIGMGMLNRENPRESAAGCLKELEKIGVTRQTVLETFTWDDFQAGAKKYGLPALAVPWLKEFFDAIQTEPKAEVPPAEANG